MTRWQVPAILTSIVVGTAIGLAVEPGGSAELVVAPALIALLAITFAGIDLDALRRTVGVHRRVALAGLGLNFVWTPLVAGLLGWALLAGQADLRIGLVMLLVTPCTEWYLVFTASARGDVGLGAAMLPPNLVLQLLLLPIYLSVFAGSAASVPVQELLRGVALVLGVPIALAAGVRFVAARTGRRAQLDAALERAEPVTLALLVVAVAAIFATHARLVVDEPEALLRLLGPLLAFFAIAYGAASVAARGMRLGHPQRVALTLSTLARNSPVALAIAVVALPDRPLVAVALVVGPLVELPVLALVSSRLRRIGDGLAAESSV